jgi:pimeloyl-ACP methyl ester carboxylesterase
LRLGLLETGSATGDVSELGIDGRRVFYSECGSGAPIVLLHAGAGSGKQWAKTARLLEPRFRVIAPDLWGLSAPALVMCGEKTTIADRRVTEILRDHIPRCRYEVIPGAEHMSPLSHPGFIAEAIERHGNAEDIR